ncbi:hypothetical protein M433DRAFT_152618 [Acidomyces richmondensis BFW]|nr:MAG: hypothetical protein FE78DRAFT_89120 [Acidomyces sp. 'richmondensis']KYG47086.1 hypothetical protein M433DRAFT_152618 [Acidomyces richmondensis BFW]
MARSQLFNIFLCFFSLLTFLSGLCETIVAAMTRACFLKSRGDIFWIIYDKFGVIKAPDTPYMITALSSGEIAAGILGLVASIVAFAFSTTMFVRWVFGETDNDKPLTVRLDPDHPYSSDVGWDDYLTWEGWTCGLESPLSNYTGGQWWERSCNLNRASRWALIPLVVLSFGISILVAVIRALQKIEDDKKNLGAKARVLKT